MAEVQISKVAPFIGQSVTGVTIYFGTSVMPHMVVMEAVRTPEPGPEVVTVTELPVVEPEMLKGAVADQLIVEPAGTSYKV